ncbi:hypothetical protein [Streptomyces caniscabiei]|uniref:hypothetical protein n=1 Tax=Streptomyces caniscabiei TaxID=2746961 RepID=UPI000A8FD05B|nr:hypothetical protein [Streptomyces caniscabiei]
MTSTLTSLTGPRPVTRPGRAFAKARDSYTPAVGDVAVEVVVGTTWHTVVTVMRLR